MGQIATTRYDGAGRVKTTVDALGNGTTTAFDAVIRRNGHSNKLCVYLPVA